MGGAAGGGTLTPAARARTIRSIDVEALTGDEDECFAPG
jgi:hypothetical protein